MPKDCLEQSRPLQARVPLSLRHTVFRRTTHGPQTFESYMRDTTQVIY
jgi:hypothetical protein